MLGCLALRVGEKGQDQYFSFVSRRKMVTLDGLLTACETETRCLYGRTRWQPKREYTKFLVLGSLLYSVGGWSDAEHASVCVDQITFEWTEVPV